MKKNSKVATTSNVAKSATKSVKNTKSTKASAKKAEAKQTTIKFDAEDTPKEEPKKKIKTKSDVFTPEHVKKMYEIAKKDVKTDAKTFQGVEQYTKVTAKVIKELGLTLKRYIKNDGTESSLYILTSKEAKGTKHLHDILTSGKMSKICKYWGYVNGYKVSEKNIEAFSKALGVKVS